MIKTVFKRIIVFALTLQARLVLKKYKPSIIAVTGSVGKTSTKDAIYAVLSAAHFVRKSEKSFNSDIGIPLTILGIPNAWYNPLLWVRNIIEGCALILLKNHYPRWLVLEVGADRPGDIEKIARWLTPDMVVVTRIPDVPVHVEFFDSPEAVVHEKEHIAKALKPGGTLILNNDDERVRAFSVHAQDAVPIMFGCSEYSTFRVSHERIVYDNGKPTGYTFRVDHQGNSVPVEIHGVLGIQHVYPALAALAAGSVLGMNMVEMGEALARWKPAPGRMRLIEGLDGTMIIDDSYNSSPVAAAEALRTLQQIQTQGRRIAVLGDMLELGRYSAAEHRGIGELASQVCDLLVTVGVRAKAIGGGAKEHARKKGNVLSFEDAAKAGVELRKKLQPGDIILVKGSQSMRLERVVETLMAHPEQKKRLLVRQEDAWRTLS